MEIFDVVDENGLPTGETVTREQAHISGVRHRTSHVWLTRKSGGETQILLQKRSASKDSYPGCLDISSAGHIPAGQGFKESAVRELKEELGVDASAEELILCGTRRFGYTSQFHGRPFCDNQVSRVYVLRRDMEAGDFSLQREEVEAVRWIEYGACLEMVRQGTERNCIRLEELEMIGKYL